MITLPKQDAGALALVVFAVALLLALLFTHRVRALAIRYGLVDAPDGHRRQHKGIIPRGGGVAVYLATMLVVGGSIMFSRGFLGLMPQPLGTILAGGGAVFALGLWDDIRPLGARFKFTIEALVSLALFASGLRIAYVGGSHVPLPPWVSAPLTALWIVGLTNAFNLVDGSDGVAAGVAMFASLAMAAMSLLAGSQFGLVAALALAGAVLGFLFFNFPPASIFLGDSGSLFLGYTLAVLGIVTTQKAPATVAVVIPVVACGVPILDTSLAMVRRFLRGERIFTPDRGHIHHRLSDLGHSPREVALLLYAASAGLAVLSLALFAQSGLVIAIMLLVAGLVVWAVVQRLRIPELVELGRLVQRGMRQRSVIGMNVRVRAAVDRLQDADDPVALRVALERAFAGAGVRRAEFWVEDGLAAALQNAFSMYPEGHGFAWTWLGRDESAESLWELHLPIRDFRGQLIGHVALWQSADGEQSIAHVRTFALELQPELYKALLRVRVRGNDGRERRVAPASALATVVHQ